MIVPLLLSFSALATAQNLRAPVSGNATLGCPVQATCYSGSTMGVCVSRSSGCCRGTFNSGNLCPGSNDIQCCYDAPCTTSHGSGKCMQTSLCKSQGGTPDSGNYCDGPADLQCCVSGGSGKITRDEVIARAQDWVNRRIPYSQTALTGAVISAYVSPLRLLILDVDGYRQDCSGMVSMAWRSSTDGGGHWTGNLQEICHKVTRSEMARGDILLAPSHHVLIFDYWLDNDRFMEYAEHDYGDVASHDATSYSYYANQGFFPCRYNDIA